MLKVIITGANSFIGKNIIKYLSDYQFTEIDMQAVCVQDIDFSNTTAIIHLAAIVHQKKSISDEIYFKVNSDLAYETAWEAKKQGVKHFIFFSTIKVYGDGGFEDKIFSEISDCQPIDGYGKSKLDAEKRILAIADDHFRVSIVRPSMVYGKGVKANMLMLSKLVQKLPIIPLAGINNNRAMVSIDNLMITLDAIIKNSQTGIYLACDRSTVSTSELVNKLIKLLNPDKKLLKLPKLIISILKLIFPHYSRRLFGSFNVDATETHIKLNIKNKLVPMEIGLQKMLNP